MQYFETVIGLGPELRSAVARALTSLLKALPFIGVFSSHHPER